MLDRRMRPNSLVLCCFSLLVCLSVYQLITGPGPPSDYLEVSPFVNNWITDANATYEYPLHTLPPNDYTRLMDITNFEFTIMNQSCNETSPLLLILIHSAPNNADRRTIIRQTWGQRMNNVVVLFVLGKSSKRMQYKLNIENATYGDFVQGNFRDSYKNVTYKHAAVLKYAIYHCPAAKYILKTDDDVFVNLISYQHFLHEELSPIGGKDLLFCNIRQQAAVHRSYRSKWHVSFAEFRPAYYPDMCPGWSVLYSPDVLFKLYAELQKTKYFWIDDVLITGVIREKLNITLIDNQDYFLHNDEVDNLENFVERKYLYGPSDVTVAQIRQLWDYTLRHVESKQFRYAFAQTNGNHNHTLNGTLTSPLMG